MPRPAKADKPVEKTINLPTTLCVQVDLILWSELEERVPHGAWARYVTGLIEADLEARRIRNEALKKESWGEKYATDTKGGV